MAAIPSCSSLNQPREFVLRKDGQWNFVWLETTDSQSHEQKLKHIEEDINRWKEKVHDICSNGANDRNKWRIHTQRMHPLHVAPKVLRDEYNMGKNSQAFCKFLEILCRYPEICHNSRSEFRSFHLCEVPGHFVLALDRFLTTFHARKQWYWEANSMNPHCESLSPSDMLLDDDLIVSFPDRWNFGSTGTGDVTKLTCTDMRKMAGEGFDLVTADGSLYAQDNPGGQEQIVLQLLNAEANAALRMLRPGGTFVVKLYSLFLSESRNFVINLASRFRSAVVFKPLCSKGGNSERYLICKGFSTEESIGSQSDITSIVIECEKYFSELQGAVIKNNIGTFDAISKEEINKNKDRALATFLKRIFADSLRHSFKEPIAPTPPALNPWKTLYGTNYVERLKSIANVDLARQFMNDQLREEILSNDSLTPESVEVEWANDEINFLHSLDLSKPLIRCENERSVVLGPAPDAIRHSLFTRPDWLFAARQIHPELVVDLCHSECGLSDYARKLHSGIIENKVFSNVVIDASQMKSKHDWLFTLSLLLENLQNIELLKIVYGKEGGAKVPLILSRFSASVIVFLTILFSKFEMKSASKIAEFSYPNYPEDIPQHTEIFLKEIDACSEKVLQFVPLYLLASIHGELVNFNRRQWRIIMQRLGTNII